MAITSGFFTVFQNYFFMNKNCFKKLTDNEIQASADLRKYYKYVFF